MREKFIEVLDGKATYFILGDVSSTKAVILVHGSGMRKDHMLLIATKLTGCKVIVVDLPEHGNNSISLPENDSIEDLSKIFNDILGEIQKQEHIQETVLCGYSLGAILSLNLMTSFEEIRNLVGGIILNGAASLENSLSREELLSHPMTDYMDKMIGTATSQELASGIMASLGLGAPSPDVCMKDLKLATSASFLDKVNLIKKPVLFMYGTEDGLVSPEDVNITINKIEDASSIRSEGAAHCSPFERLQFTAIAIQSFIDKYLLNPVS